MFTKRKVSMEKLLILSLQILKKNVTLILTLALILQLKYNYKTHVISLAVGFINTVIKTFTYRVIIPPTQPSS
jgi:hypothetical protein